MDFDEISSFMTTNIPAHYCEEPRGKFHAHWIALARPKDENDLQALLAWARKTQTPITPYGGGTGLVGGQISTDPKGAICLSMENFKSIHVEGDSVLVGAGVVLDELHEALSTTRYHFPLSLASSGSAQIGGLISTNAGGVHVIRHGTMGEQVLGLRALLMSGDVIDHTKNLRKDNTGYRLDRLMIGAEGTLGIITHARLKLAPKDIYVSTLLAAIDTPLSAFNVLEKLKSNITPINAFELISQTTWEIREEAGFDPTPIGAPPWCVLIELAGEPSAFEPVISQLGESIVAQNTRERAALWQLRETIPLANRKIGSLASHDISLPLDRVSEFIDTMSKKLGAMDDVRINCFGHMGDGNLHYNLFAAQARARESYDVHCLSETVYRGVVDFGGSISAEHGVGRLKGDMMRKLGQSEKLGIMHKIKSALDPENLLNPGVFFPNPDHQYGSTTKK